MSADDEISLVNRAIAGDESALTTLLDRCGPIVRGRIGADFPRRWQSVLSVDDVLQQAYTDAFLAVRRFSPQGEGAFLAWLTRLAKNAMLDAIDGLEALKRGGDRRRVGVTRQESLVDLLDVVNAVSRTPSRAVAGDESFRALEAAIEKLPSVHRQVITLYDLQGRSIEEVAAAVGRSQGAVFMLRSRAHHSLAESLGSPSLYRSV